MSEASRSGEFFNSYEPAPTYGEKRQCSEKGCKTVLSRYNPSDRCSQHRHSKIRIPLKKKRRP